VAYVYLDDHDDLVDTVMLCALDHSLKLVGVTVTREGAKELLGAL
jgi:hypothetical protein